MAGFNLSLGNLEIHLLGDNSHFAKMMRSTETMMAQTAQRMKKVGKTLTSHITVPVTAMAGASIWAFAKFDDAMTQSLAIMKNVSPQLRAEMEQTAKVISTQSVKSADELARSYFFLASAGLTAEQSMAALPTVTSFATAGMFDMAQATDLLTDAQSALGLTVEDSEQNMMNMTRVSDVLVRANTLANASVEQFSTALTSKAGTAMKSYNIQLEEGVAVLAAYADQGIKAELAGNMFDRMLRLTIKSINDNKQAWEENGIATTDASGNLLPLADILEQVHNKTKNLGSVQKAAALEMLGFEARSQQAILPLLGLSDKIRDYQAGLEGATNYTKDVANKQLQSFASQMKILWNNVKVAAIEIGQVLAPWILKLSQYVQMAVTWFRGLDEGTQRWIIGIALVSAALGPLLVMMSKLLFLGHNILRMFALYGGAAIAIGAIVVAVWALVDAFTETDLKILNFFRNIRIGGTKIGTWMDVLATYVWQVWDYSTSKILHYFMAMWEGIKEGGRKAWRFILEVGKLINESFWAVINSITSGVALMIRKSAENMARIRGVSQETVDAMLNGAAELQNKVSNAGRAGAKAYEDAISKSLEKSQQSAEEYYAKTEELEKRYTENAKMWAKARQDAFAKDDPNTTSAGGPKPAVENPGIQAQQQVNAMMAQLRQQDTDNAQDNATKQIDIEKAKNSAMLENTGTLFGALASVAQAGGKKAFKVYKALAIAEATIATYSAYTKALASPPGPPATYPLAAAALATGLLKVRQIAMMKVGGGASISAGTGGYGATAGATTAPEEVTTPATVEGKTPQTTIIIENVHGSADEEFADMLAEKIADRSVDGRDYGFETTSR